MLICIEILIQRYNNPFPFLITPKGLLKADKLPSRKKMRFTFLSFLPPLTAVLKPAMVELGVGVTMEKGRKRDEKVLPSLVLP